MNEACRGKNGGGYKEHSVSGSHKDNHISKCVCSTYRRGCKYLKIACFFFTNETRSDY